MGRLIVFLLLAALVVYVVRALAPLFVLGALLLLVVAWRWPQALAGALHSPRFVWLPTRLRDAPLAFAATLAAVSLALVWVASAVTSTSTAEPEGPPAAAATPSNAARSATPTAASIPPAGASVAQPPAAAGQPSPDPGPPEAEPASSLGIGLKPTGPTQVAQVVSITDGDTIRVNFGGREYAVRYIGMDTPETHFGVEPFGPEAADENARLVAGKQVVLEKDVSETDRYGRLLRYVWLHDTSQWLLVNLELVRLGFAQVATYPPDVKWIDPYLLDAQRDAREAGRGLWAEQVASSPTAQAPTATPPPAAVGGSCEPSYPDICIPLNSPDLDCGDISARRFRVVYDVPNPDPMRFDGDRDGIGCES